MTIEEPADTPAPDPREALRIIDAAISSATVLAFTQIALTKEDAQLLRAALAHVEEAVAAARAEGLKSCKDSNYRQGFSDAALARAEAVPGPAPKADRQALWDKFTGGEKLAYGVGYRDAQAEAVPGSGLDVIREEVEALPTVVQPGAFPVSASKFKSDVLAILARLSSKPSEDDARE